MRHPDRSRSSGGGRDLPLIGCISREIPRPAGKIAGLRDDAAADKNSKANTWQIIHCVRRPPALALSCSRGSPTSLPSPPSIRSFAAMSVQLNAVPRNPPLYIVLYCLTPAQIPRYISLTLCLPYPAGGENTDGPHRAGIIIGGGRIRLVNRRSSRENPHFSQMRRGAGHPVHWQPATDNWPLE